ncbi:MAG: recombinase RecA [Candidatus Margulisiibacteriota bacterium]|nr:MAG: hypothetical protein A2X43_13575 [Candidatus Margulisbacteria bacterium GWD2_39_127]OGI05336.1 MAG: hypothetical protein A2X42_05785 [Candidatus Margulisbacteria bacterium GWF2_38_17]OGI06039.1 MAG: hypothetical protein A2X41_06250 [Candidatus Margulisbacteria bacterium GWE2_39_32]PZM77321.1 MAG: recombinase RecA [Candidatus Margulisiibacteriota bacterium]HAR62563.1 recombinase RecA [Candidatus Margulisiibacteriota bacterium]
MEKISTGIIKLDELLGGGYPKGKSILIAGEPGTGKTLLSLQYLIDGAKRGEKGIYVSIDEKPEHVIHDAQEMGWDLKKYLDDGTILVIDISSYFAKVRMAHDDMFDYLKIIDDLSEHVTKMQAKRLVLDPIAPMIFTESSFPLMSEYIRKLIFTMDGNPHCTTLMTSHIPVGTNQLGRYGIEEFLSTGVIVLKLLRAVESRNQYIRSIFVRKMRGIRVELVEYSYEIVTERGLVIRQPV